MTLAKNIRLGIFILLGLLFFLIALYFIGNKRNMFSSSLTIKARFHNIGGLQKGNNVRLMGIDVGTVKKIIIINDTLVEVEMQIKKSAAEFIKKDAVATVGTDGLMGNRVVNISAGNAVTAQIENDDTILTQRQIDAQDILRTVEQTSQHTAILTAELVNIVKDIHTGKGPLGVILKDSVISYDLKQTISNLKNTSNEALKTASYFRQISSDINSGSGVVGAAVHDTVLRRSLIQTLADMELTAAGLKQSSENLRILTYKLDNGEGTIATLINDTALANNLKATILSAKAGTEGFNKNMEALKHNFLLRPYFKKLEKNKP